MISRRNILGLGGVSVVGAAAFSLRPAAGTRTRTASVMTPVEALSAAASGDILIVDVRRPDEWAQTGVAEHAIPIDMRDDDFLAKLSAARASETQPVALICARGVRSARVTRWLQEAQIAPIIDIPEGMLGSSAGPGWIARALPVNKVN